MNTREIILFYKGMSINNKDKIKNSIDKLSSAMIIPTRIGDRGVSEKVFLERWRNQSWLPDELIVIRGASNPSIARNLGAASTTADLLIFADDDGIPCHNNTLEAIVKALECDDSVWWSAAAIQLPLSSSQFQKAYVKQIPQNIVSIPKSTKDSVQAYSLCCCIRSNNFTKIKEFDERLTSGEDADVRDRIRSAGGRVVLAANAGVYHPPPGNLIMMLKRGYWYGKGEAQIASLFKDENWREETKPKRLFNILLKALASLACLILNWDSLRYKKIKFGFQPLRMFHIWAMTFGYITGKLFGNNRKMRINDVKVDIIKLK
ncbi:MAG: hypothetical protein P9X24_19505 [Candidatus Hatepunaea meridiana]|nr:hypothetical protein [Candidatus Hatepunaea meridiana]